MTKTKISEMENFTLEDKFSACEEFFQKLAELLKDKYEIVGSPNKVRTKHLVLFGTADELTYYSKPDKSFRMAFYWNWYASLKKCENPFYIQCRNKDLPRLHGRPGLEKASKPVRAAQVAVIGDDGHYHAVFGEVYHNKKWYWLENDPAEIAKMYV